MCCVVFCFWQHLRGRRIFKAVTMFLALVCVDFRTKEETTINLINVIETQLTKGKRQTE